MEDTVSDFAPVWSDTSSVVPNAFVDQRSVFSQIPQLAVVGSHVREPKDQHIVTIEVDLVAKRVSKP